MALIPINVIDPKAPRYDVPELITKDFHSRIDWRFWRGLWRRHTTFREHVFTHWTECGELIGQPTKIVCVTGLWICGFSRHTWTKLPKPLGWGMDFGLSEETGIVTQQIALPKEGDKFTFGDKIGIVISARQENPPDDFPKTHIEVRIE